MFQTLGHCAIQRTMQTLKMNQKITKVLTIIIPPFSPLPLKVRALYSRSNKGILSFQSRPSTNYHWRFRYRRRRGRFRCRRLLEQVEEASQGADGVHRPPAQHPGAELRAAEVPVRSGPHGARGQPHPHRHPGQDVVPEQEVRSNRMKLDCTCMVQNKKH